MKELTDRQRAVVAFIRDHINENGFPPTRKEIGAALGIGSTNGVNDHLRALERKGAISITPVISRGIRLVDEVSP